MTSVTIPAGVAEIVDGTFSGCTALKNISLSEGLTFIGEEAFTGCTSLIDLMIPDSCRDIELGAFNECPQINIHATDDDFLRNYLEERDEYIDEMEMEKWMKDEEERWY